MGEHGSVNCNSVALNRQSGQGAQKPNCSATGGHEYKPPKPEESSIPMPKGGPKG